jgi:hypothetical protein
MWYFIMEIKYQDPIMAKDNHCKWQIIMTFFTWCNEELAMKSHHSCWNLSKKSLLQCGKVRKVSSLLVLQGRNSHNITLKSCIRSIIKATSDRKHVRCLYDSWRKKSLSICHYHWHGEVILNQIKHYNYGR